MSLVKVEGVSNEVFIPDQITDEERSFLLDSAACITTEIQHAALKVGMYLVEVQGRFRDDKSFGGPKGWFVKWYKSIGLSCESVQSCVNAVKLHDKFPELQDKISLLSKRTLRSIVSAHAKGGLSTEDQRALLTEAEELRYQHVDAYKQIPEVKQRAIDEHNGLSRSAVDPEQAKSQLQNLISQGSRTTHAPTGVCSDTPKEGVKTVVDTSAQDEVKAQYEALLKQNSQLSAEMQKLQEAKDNWEKMYRAADKKVERMSGAAREWENWDWERRMDLVNVYITHFAESAGMYNFCQGDVDDSARRALVSPEARFKSHEKRAIQAISMWINVLSVEGVQELKDVLEDRGELPPVDFVDSRELITIDV